MPKSRCVKFVHRLCFTTSCRCSQSRSYMSAVLRGFCRSPSPSSRVVRSTACCSADVGHSARRAECCRWTADKESVHPAAVQNIQLPTKQRLITVVECTARIRSVMAARLIGNTVRTSTSWLNTSPTSPAVKNIVPHQSWLKNDFEAERSVASRCDDRFSKFAPFF